MSNQTAQDKNRRTMRLVVIVPLLMLCLGFASKPLYDTFCRVTGYGGTTKEVTSKSDRELDRVVTIRFDANIQSELSWSFKPETSKMDVRLGQNAIAFYTATNSTDSPLVGTASYNVSPVKAAQFFSKVECFCYSQQRLEAGEEVRMPVLFYVDPDMADDPRYDDITDITLSYTFHKVDNPDELVIGSQDRQDRLQELQEMGLVQ